MVCTIVGTGHIVFTTEAMKRYDVCLSCAAFSTPFVSHRGGESQVCPSMGCTVERGCSDFEW